MDASRIEPLIGLHTENARDRIIHTDAASFSTLKLFARSAAHAHWSITHPTEPTEAMDWGNALHLAVLEPERFDAECAVAPKVDRRTKEGKATWACFQAEHAGYTILTQEQFDGCRGARDAVWAHPIAAEMLRGPGHSEVGAIWSDGVAHCKALIDRIGLFDKWTWLLDLKSCRDASEEGFAKSVANQLYHVQAAMIVDGCNVIEPRERKFGWIAVESEPPHCVAVYEPDLLTMTVGRELYAKFLAMYIDAKRTGAWPGYPRNVRALSLPRWAQGVAGDE